MSILGVIGSLGGLSGLGDLVGSVMNSVTASRLNEKKMAFESEEAQKARDWNEAMYNKYNSPIAQVQQYKDAGLNPNLLYGNGATIPQVQSSAQATAGNLENPRYGDMLGAGLSSAVDVALKKAQIENIEADTAKKDIETENLDANGFSIRRQKRLLEIMDEGLPDFDEKGRVVGSRFMTWQDWQDLIDSGQENLTSSLWVEYKKLVKSNNESEIAEFTRKHILPAQYEKIGEEVRNIISDTNVKDKNADYLVALKNLTNSQIGKIAHEIRLLDSETTLNGAKARLTNLEADWRHDYGFSSGTIAETVAGAFSILGLSMKDFIPNLLKKIYPNFDLGTLANTQDAVKDKINSLKK